MDWIEEVRIRLNKNNRILFTKKSAYLQDLVRLFQEQNHRIMALWAFDFAEETVARLEEKYPEELRPREALEAVRDWAAGKLKMRAAQQKILACHAFAKEIESKEDISLCHAVGQACAVVHTAGHAVGYPVYDLTAVVYRYGIEHCSDAVEARKREYTDRLLYWKEHWREYAGQWADFMCRE